MGWKGYESSISLGMIFKKMYCHKCGFKLEKKKISNIYKKGDPNFSNDILGRRQIGMDRKEVVHYIYRCPNCSSEITYDEQCKVTKKQKKLKRIILNEDSVEEIYNNKNICIQIARKRILKMRWLLLLPLFGGVICMVYIFSGCLSEKVEKRDLHKLTCSSILILIGAALGLKWLFSAANISFINGCRTTEIIIIVLLLLLYNLPVLLYINRVFDNQNE